jgi:catechol 2,3-dioxygenase-like lactoylglutathione lyase family enzyme
MASRWLRRAIPVLSAPDLTEAVTFYVQKLGCRQIIQSHVYAGVARDGIEIHFAKCADANLPKNSSCRVEVVGIDALYEELKPHGILHPHGDLVDRPWGYREFVVLDCFGNAVNFAEKIP